MEIANFRTLGARDGEDESGDSSPQAGRRGGGEAALRDGCGGPFPAARASVGEPWKLLKADAQGANRKNT